MRILITGSSGFIGKKIKSYFENLHHQIIGLALVDADINIDLSDEKIKLTENLFDQDVDVIIHGAFKIPQSPNGNNNDLYLSNQSISNNLVKIGRIVKPKIIINLSSIAVYPNVSGIFTEESATNPDVNWNSQYGRSKLYTEELFTKEFQNSETKVCHLRIAQLLDENLKDQLQKSFMDEINGSNSITVFANGNRESNFLYTSDLCKIIDKAISNCLNGIYNVGKEQKNYLFLAKEFVLKYGNIDTKINIIEKGTPTKFVLDCSKLLSAIN